MAKVPVTFNLNNSEAAVFVDLGASLIDVLRRGIGDLTPKQGCAQGTCGACTVLIEGVPHLSCLTMAETVDGRAVVTVGGLADGPRLHALQVAFMEGFAAQCGFCTPGMLMAGKALLDRTPNPSRTEVIDAISGNLCRCTGYEPIVDAILSAAARMQGRAV
ncbi:(2Fe-2S)-binding protein [Rhizobium sp. P28RR-XV]|uniref:(2Fe-2S)-binding protein n=1 Tax=Rhizobium sp. P28RR-XV TaxID=2726737 RepID=UPI00145657A7|nr:(2Fe-2S)-binding protein [Rhizobium sp. P28RR-XV]NLR88409.1 (2Fe-2S)-binding protein [Rhizobium sp. P28RR-XV]